MKTLFYLTTLSCIIFSFTGCGNQEEEAYLPKPRGFHRIEFPQHLYDTDQFKSKEFEDYPYIFGVAQNAEIIPDKSFMSEPYWIEVRYPEFDAIVDISYKNLPNYDSLVGYINTSNTLTFKHNVKATAIDEYTARTKNGYSAVMYEIEGDVPSQFQFFVTDSTKHFFRAALYFPTSSQNDSLAPVIEFVKEDMLHMMNSLDWRD
ncbi:gliding motility lipoprotein GldD [Flammeovirga kamogawensis]|uniref:Gliding motility lipoprotein GldD n=1 Tax=Flammeovirga kamogawensis TaxID=373891 RepID=A0ABX8GS70_9BACT|nr:gliding motility lipoprotein GldD [Flammeovirga kamogawensis]MBB6461349.1 gliding motility-associated lipoprotein GldD [Flammeovirga kamogawensis]QWG06254.1 gliding motility lipoprotein GldD [Flammeovirga kamogawensis]TRX68084.1 gliding motility lipoprotein GldD [Flammeovirga kamogawensis]